MNAKHKRDLSKSGGVLVMVVIVVLTFSVLAIGLFKLFGTNAVEVVYAGQSKQAFWVAESGLQDAVQRLRYDTGFHSIAAGGSATFSVSNNLGQARYDVTVSRTGGNPLIHYNSFDVFSVGWVRGMNRQIKQEVSTIPGYIAAIMAPKNINIAQNTLVDGPIAVMDGGTLTLNDKIPPGQNEDGDFDIIILDDGSAISRRSGANEGKHYDIVDLPAPEMPTMPDFSDLFATATNETVITSTNVVNFGTIDLGGITNYYNYPLGIEIVSITGSGAIVNTGDINLTPKSNVGDVDVVANVSIFSFGSVNIGQKNDFVGDTLIYAAGTVYFGDHSIASQKSVILADGKEVSGMGITLGGHSQFQGIIFADEGTVEIEQGSNGSETRVEGTVISGEGVDLGQNSEVIFNREMFNDDLFDLSDFFEEQVIVTKSVWEEVAPL